MPRTGSCGFRTKAIRVTERLTIRFVLIGVDVHAAVFFELDKPQPVVLYELAKGWLTGDTPDLGQVHRIDPS